MQPFLEAIQHLLFIVSWPHKSRTMFIQIQELQSFHAVKL